MKSSTKSVLLALSAAGLSGVVIATASAQKFVPRGDQTCANKSTARDNTQGTDKRCLHPKSGPAFEKWMEQQAAARGNSKADAPLVPGGPPRRDYNAPNGGVPYPAPSKGKKPR